MPAINPAESVAGISEVVRTSEHFSENSQPIFHFPVDGLGRHP
jgi:hypothetical protein